MGDHKPFLDTPRAILLGGAMIGAGLYLGLAQRTAVAPSKLGTAEASVDRPPSSSARNGETTMASVPVDTPVVGPSAAPSAGARTASATDATIAAFAAQKSNLQTRCKAELGNTNHPARFLINVAYGPDGHQIIRGFSETREDRRPGLIECIQSAMPALEIPPPGVTVHVDTPLTLP